MTLKAHAIGIFAAGAMMVSAVATPTPASAHPLLVPLIIGAVIVGGVLVAAANANEYHRGGVSVGPDRALNCRVIRHRTQTGHIRRARVCD